MPNLFRCEVRDKMAKCEGKIGLVIVNVDVREGLQNYLTKIFGV